MDVQVNGLAELDSRLAEMGAIASTKIMRAALYAATKPILAKAQATAPRRSGALQLSISRSYAVRNKANFRASFFGTGGSRFVVNIAPRTKQKAASALHDRHYQPKTARRKKGAKNRTGRGIFYGHFLEWGTKRGVNATHWLRNALTSTSRTATALLAVELKKRIEAAARKSARAARKRKL